MTRPVLIVEDDADIAEGLRYNLEREGLAARVAETGEKGLAAALDRKNPPALILRELMARVKAVLRRTADAASAAYEDEKLKVHFEEMRAVCDGVEVRLTRKEFALLAALARRHGKVATRHQLLDEVWGHEYYGDTRTLDVHIRRLRQKLGPCGEAIETVVGVGYRFVGCPARGGDAAAGP